MINLRDFKKVEGRRKFLEKILGISLENIGYFSLDERQASAKNCENMIGVAQVPMGVAGPIKIKNQKLKIKNYFIPLATTEGALVASVNRGCKAINLSKGANVLVENIGATRAPVFKVKDIKEGLRLKKWIKENFFILKKEAEKTSSHLTLKNFQTFFLGKSVFVRFVFDTREAMGMNMATIATDKIIEFIEEKTKAKSISITGNLCVDKKPNWLNFILGRGKKVWAEATLSKKVVKKVLKTTAKKIFKVWLNKCLLGSSLAGSLGFNSQFANIVAAIFLSLGQDLAHVVEGSLGITTTEIDGNGDLYVSIYLPSLMVGTVGGGTSLATQKEALAILGVDSKKGGALELAEVIGGAVLAGEISLLASLAEGSLAEAHKKLARGIY